MGGSSSRSAGDTTDCGAVNAKESGDISGGAACIKHGENLGLLLGREFGLPAALAALSSCRAKTGLGSLADHGALEFGVSTAVEFQASVAE